MIIFKDYTRTETKQVVFENVAVMGGSDEDGRAVAIGLTGREVVHDRMPCAMLRDWERVNEIIDLLRRSATVAFGPDPQAN